MQTKSVFQQSANWDLASTCSIGGRHGIVLVEGKAHRGELKEDGKFRGNGQNDEQIERAIEEANQGLNGIRPGWNLSRDSHYQLCNRFAWAWKIAFLGVPTILVYLGFLHATEMSDLGAIFGSPEDWSKAVRYHSSNRLAAGGVIVPGSVWETRLQTVQRSLRHANSTITLDKSVPTDMEELVANEEILPDAIFQPQNANLN